MNCSTKSLVRRKSNAGFSLFEVVLAVGVLAVSILALLGLFGPTMSSVRDVVDASEASSVLTRLNAALMSDEIYQKIPSNTFENFAAALPVQLFFWQERAQLDGPLELKYSADRSDIPSDFSVIAGQAFIVTMERGVQTGGVDEYDFGTVADQGYFPILVSIYAVPVGELVALSVNDFVAESEPILSYTTAKLR